MGQAKRRRERGEDVQKRAIEVLHALNSAAGGGAWWHVRSGRADVTHAYLADETEERPKLISVETTLDERPSRAVSVSLLRNGRSWISTLIVDHDPVFDSALYDDLGRWASEIASPILGEGRIPTASLVVRTAWPKQDAEEIRRRGVIVT